LFDVHSEFDSSKSHCYFQRLPDKQVFYSSCQPAQMTRSEPALFGRD